MFFYLSAILWNVSKFCYATALRDCQSNLKTGRVATPGWQTHTQPLHTIVRPYLPAGANVHAHLTHDSLSPPHPPSQPAAQSVQPLHSHCTLYVAPPHFPPKISPFLWGDLGPHLIHGSLDPSDPSPHRNGRYFQNRWSLPTDWDTDRPTELRGNSTGTPKTGCS